MGSSRFASIRVRRGESDLWIGWRPPGAEERGRAAPSGPAEEGRGFSEIERTAEMKLEEVRNAIRTYAARRSGFLSSLEPVAEDLNAPPVAAAMLSASRAAAVGPMAAVAGAIAEAVGRAVKEAFGFHEVVVENGGDLWIDVRSPLVVSVYAGLSSLSETFGIVVRPELCPCGLACSSGTVGPSLSFGNADAAVVLCGDAAAADAWATSLGNRLRSAADLESAVRGLLSMDGGSSEASPAALAEEFRPRGAVAVMADRMAAAGAVALVPLERAGTV